MTIEKCKLNILNVDPWQPRLTPLFCAGSGQQSVEYVIISFTGILTHNSILTEKHTHSKSPMKKWSVTHINDQQTKSYMQKFHDY